MAQETVADLAKEFRMSVDETVEMLIGLGVDVEQADSAVEEADAEIFRELIAEERRQQLEMQRREKRQKAGDYVEGEIREDMRTTEEIEEAKLKADTSAIEIEPELTLRQLAEVLQVDPGELIVRLAAAGQPATINTKFSAEQAAELAQTNYNVRLRRRAPKVEEQVAAPGKTKRQGGVPIPPVVTIMGHVDHGKTTLLDTLRHSNVVSGEAGGITQHIGAYQVDHEGQLITFIDTPGHEAFTSMRARGAQVTDIIILMIAADDGVMPQTVEAINHAKAADVPIIVALNKVDLPEADPDRVKQQLLEHQIVVEDFGGEVPAVEVSALTGEGVDDLLATIVAVSEIAELRGNPRLNPIGTVIEANLDKGRGPVATILVRDGTLVKGDSLVIGTAYGRVRAMLDSNGNDLKKAGPSVPVQVIGLNEVPEVGDAIEVAKNDRRARKLAEERATEMAEEQRVGSEPEVSLDDFFAQVQAGAVESLNVIVKGDVQGSVEAIVHKLSSLKTTDVRVDVKHAAVGPVGKSDVDLAKTTEAIVIGFNVGVDPQVRKMADDEKVEIRLYAVIYHLIDDVRRALEGLLEPEYREDVLGHAEVLQLFKISRVGNVAGCRVSDGSMVRGENIRVTRDGAQIFNGRLDSLKRVQENVAEVSAPLECGIHLNGFRDFQEGDIIECYRVSEIARTLDV